MSANMLRLLSLFFVYDAAATEIYTLSLHDALPISAAGRQHRVWLVGGGSRQSIAQAQPGAHVHGEALPHRDRKSTRLNSSHMSISYAVFCLKKKKNKNYVHHNE